MPTWGVVRKLHFPPSCLMSWNNVDPRHEPLLRLRWELSMMQPNYRALDSLSLLRGPPPPLDLPIKGVIRNCSPLGMFGPWRDLLLVGGYLAVGPLYCIDKLSPRWRISALIWSELWLGCLIVALLLGRTRSVEFQRFHRGWPMSWRFAVWCGSWNPLGS